MTNKSSRHLVDYYCLPDKLCITFNFEIKYNILYKYCFDPVTL